MSDKCKNRNCILNDNGKKCSAGECENCDYREYEEREDVE